MKFKFFIFLQLFVSILYSQPRVCNGSSWSEREWNFSFTGSCVNGFCEGYGTYIRASTKTLYKDIVTGYFKNGFEIGKVTSESYNDDGELTVKYIGNMEMISTGQSYYTEGKLWYFDNYRDSIVYEGKWTNWFIGKRTDKFGTKIGYFYNDFFYGKDINEVNLRLDDEEMFNYKYRFFEIVKSASDYSGGYYEGKIIDRKEGRYLIEIIHVSIPYGEKGVYLGDCTGQRSLTRHDSKNNTKIWLYEGCFQSTR